MSDNGFWKDISDFANRQFTFQVLSIDPDPHSSIIFIIRQLQKVPVIDLINEIIDKPSPPEIVVEHPLNPICPLTKKIIFHPSRSVRCDHPECFDLSGFLCYSLKNNTWQCPICHKPLRPEDLRIDPYFFQNVSTMPQ